MARDVRNVDSLAAHLARFETEFAFGSDVRRLFRSAGIDPIFAAPVPANVQAPSGSWVLHVRLTPRLEDSFGFTQQFVVYCLNVRDLQSRCVTHVKRLIRMAEHPVASDFAMIMSCDPVGPEKIRDWAIERAEGLVLLPVSRTELNELLEGQDPGLAIPHLLERAFAERNLYDEREPVRGERFFGRADELRELDRIISHGNRHIGIFGLRRIGKTSMLLELADRLRLRPQVSPIFIDLELSSATKSAAHVVHRLGNAIAGVLASRGGMSHRAAMRALGVPPDDWQEIAAEKLITDLGVRLSAALSNGALSDTRLVVILDEAEILLPSPTEPVQHSLEFLRMVRGVSQETHRLTLVLAGVNATPSESPVIGTEDNPLFGLLAVQYLGPLEPATCDEMIKTVGRRMRIRWEPPAASAITEFVGGHPLLARLAASDVISAHPDRPLRPNAAQVRAVLAGFNRRHSSVFTQMVHSLNRYYPDELEVLRLLAAGEIEFATELVDDEPSILSHLRGYGVIESERLEISLPAFASWLRTQAK